MAQIIRLRNVPTPVLDVVYDQVVYPNFMYSGEIVNMVPNIQALPPIFLEELQSDTSEIIYYSPHSYIEGYSEIEYAPVSVAINPKTF